MNRRPRMVRSPSLVSATNALAAAASRHPPQHRMHAAATASTHDRTEVVQVARRALTLRGEVRHERIRPRQEAMLRAGTLPETADADHVAERVDAVAFTATPAECAEIFDSPSVTGPP